MDNNNNAPSSSPRGIITTNTITIHLKSGQTWDALPSLAVSSSLSLFQLKTALSHHLGDTPSPSDIVLARGEGGVLVELKEGDISSFQNEETLFVFSSKSWKAHCIIQGTSSTPEDRRNAVLETSSHDSFLHQLRQAQQASLMENDAIQGARKQLAERASLFGLQENPDIDQEGDCQFDAAADQLRKYQQFAGETKESVRARAVKWIRDNAGRDLGHKTTVKQWVEESLLEYSSFDDYLEKMARAQWWGDEVTLLAICELYQVAIIMLSSVQGGNWYRTIFPAGKSEKDELPQLWLGHEHERHYWSLMEDSDAFAPLKKKEKQGEGSISLSESFQGEASPKRARVDEFIPFVLGTDGDHLESIIHLKSGQTWDVFRTFHVSLPLSLLQLKTTVSQYLDNTPSPSDIVLTRGEGGGLMELKGDVVTLNNEETLFLLPPLQALLSVFAKGHDGKICAWTEALEGEFLETTLDLVTVACDEAGWEALLGRLVLARGGALLANELRPWRTRMKEAKECHGMDDSLVECADSDAVSRWSAILEKRRMVSPDRTKGLSVNLAKFFNYGELKPHGADAQGVFRILGRRYFGSEQLYLEARQKVVKQLKTASSVYFPGMESKEVNQKIAMLLTPQAIIDMGVIRAISDVFECNLHMFRLASLISSPATQSRRRTIHCISWDGSSFDEVLPRVSLGPSIEKSVFLPSMIDILLDELSVEEANAHSMGEHVWSYCAKKATHRVHLEQGDEVPFWIVGSTIEVMRDLFWESSKLLAAPQNVRAFNTEKPCLYECQWKGVGYVKVLLVPPGRDIVRMYGQSYWWFVQQYHQESCYRGALKFRVCYYEPLSHPEHFFHRAGLEPLQATLQGATVVLGGVEVLAKCFESQEDWMIEKTEATWWKAWICQLPPLKVVFLGLRLSFWGDLAGVLAAALFDLCGVSRIIHAGAKVGTTLGPDMKRQRLLYPRSFVLLSSKGQPIELTPSNTFTEMRRGFLSDRHASIPSPLDECKLQIHNATLQHSFNTIDCEGAYFAQAAQQFQRQFGAAYFPSDYLLRRHERGFGSGFAAAKSAEETEEEARLLDDLGRNLVSIFALEARKSDLKHTVRVRCEGVFAYTSFVYVPPQMIVIEAMKHIAADFAESFWSEKEFLICDDDGRVLPNHDPLPTRVTLHLVCKEILGRFCEKTLNPIYSKLKMSLFASEDHSLTEWYIPLSLLQDGRFKRIVELRDLWGLKETQTLRKLLVEGRAGSGKTILTRYIAYQQCCGFSSLVEWVPRFDIVILVPLVKLSRVIGLQREPLSPRHIVRSLYDLSSSQAAVVGKALEDSKARVLYLFDGLDEVEARVEGESMRSFLDGLRSSSLGWVECCIITSRRERNYQQLREVVQTELKPFSTENTRTFIECFFKHDSSDASGLRKLLKANDELSELVRVPLMCQLVCVIWSKKQLQLRPNQPVIASVFESVFNLMLHRSIKRDEFLLHDKMCPEAVAALEKLAFSTLLSPESSFDLSPLSRSAKQEVMESGLLEHHGLEKWGFIHRTFSEYLAAQNALHAGNNFTLPQLMSLLRADQELFFIFLLSMAHDVKVLCGRVLDALSNLEAAQLSGRPLNTNLFSPQMYQERDACARQTGVRLFSRLCSIFPEVLLVASEWVCDPNRHPILQALFFEKWCEFGISSTVIELLGSKLMAMPKSVLERGAEAAFAAANFDLFDTLEQKYGLQVQLDLEVIAATGNMRLLRRMVETLGFDPRIDLFSAASNNQQEAVMFLLSKHPKGLGRAVEGAAVAGHAVLVSELVKMGSFSLELLGCVQAGWWEVAQSIFEHATDMERVSRFLGAQGDKNKMHWIAQHHPTVLCRFLEGASAEGLKDLVRDILQLHPSAVQGCSVAFAASRRHVDIVILMIDAGCDASDALWPFAKNYLWEPLVHLLRRGTKPPATKYGGESFALFCAKHGQLPLALGIVQHASAPPEDFSHYVAMQGSFSNILLLIQLHGNAPMMIETAARQGHYDTVLSLLQHVESGPQKACHRAAVRGFLCSKTPRRGMRLLLEESVPFDSEDLSSVIVDVDIDCFRELIGKIDEVDDELVHQCLLDGRVEVLPDLEARTVKFGAIGDSYCPQMIGRKWWQSFWS